MPVNNESSGRNYFVVDRRSPRKRQPMDELENAFNIDNIKQEVSIWRQCLDIFLGWSNTKSTYFTTICGLCLAQPKDESDLNQFRINGYRRLNLFIRRLSKREVHLLDINLVIWCCLNLMSYFQERCQSTKGCNSFLFKRRLYSSRDLLCHVLDIEMPEKQNEIIRSCISYFTRTQQWNFEEIVLFTFQEVLALVTRKELVISRLIKSIEICQREGNIEEAQMMTTSLALILENIHLDRYQYTSKLQKCFSTLLKLYLLNNLDTLRSTQVKSANIKFRVQIKNCIRYFTSQIRDNRGLVSMMDSIAEIMLDPEIPDDEQTDLIEMVVYCAQKLRIRFYRESITPRVLHFLLSYLKSDYHNSAMASQKIFQHLLDRHDNLQYFTEPIYHFKGRSNFTVNVEYSREDVHFFKSVSQDFFGGLYKFLNRFTEMTSLVSSYTVVCLVLVEVPDPITTINMIHVVIETQNNVLKNEESYNLITKFHIHAVVASVLSLICLIHEDEVFALGKYVQEVVSYRNENSPHLLPPLSPEYNIAKHHTTEYHPQLYFLEEEVLYALRQCWLGRRRSI